MAGITAQTLRYSELLLMSPWSVRVGPESGVPVAAAVDLFVPNPTSFIVQKVLIHSDRRRDKRAQDVLYIHDTLELFGGSLAELHRLWIEEVRPRMAAKTARKAATISRKLFAEMTDSPECRPDFAGPPAHSRERSACLRVRPERDPRGLTPAPISVFARVTTAWRSVARRGHPIGQSPHGRAPRWVHRGAARPTRPREVGRGYPPPRHQARQARRVRGVPRKASRPHSQTPSRRLPASRRPAAWRRTAPRGRGPCSPASTAGRTVA
jgi:hypothetical protein